MNKTASCIIALAASFLTCSGDNVANRGLTHPQSVSTLPKSRVESIECSPPRTATLNEVVLNRSGENTYSLADGWRLFSDKDKATVYNGVVPGTVLTSLVEAGLYPDPYFGLNNLAIPDSLCRCDWWYTIDFDSPRALEGGEAWLIFDGINYIAEIDLNGANIGEMKGAFKRGMFNVTDQLRGKNNKLAVKIRPPYNPGIPHEQSPRSGVGGNGGFLCLDGPTFISSEGWDWVPGIRDRNIGLWQDVRLKFTHGVRISDPQIVTRLELPDTTKADIIIKTDVENLHPREKEVTLVVNFDGKDIKCDVKLAPMKKQRVVLTPESFPQLSVSNPRLWWPNGYGAQNLYDMKISAYDDGKLSDQDSIRFGIRELSYDLTVGYPDGKQERVNYRPTVHQNGTPILNTTDRLYVENGMCMPKLVEGVDKDLLPKVNDPDMEHYLVIKVNGKKIFCRGGNWGMDDGMKRVDRERLEPYFRLHKDANFNMIRNWTGESTEKVFYELCDEYGMLVFNDFWLSTQGYNHEVTDDDLFLDNARDVVVRFRNHPSIAVWNPRNEGFAPEYIDTALSKMIAREDGTRHYSANSTHCNLRASGPWNYHKAPEWYFNERIYGFNTEQGTTSIPTEESILAMMSQEDAWPISDVWYYHDFHGGQEDFMDDMKTKFGEGISLHDFCKKAQILNYDAHRAMLEATNSRMWNSTSGLLLWMSHPAWPSMIWQAYSSDYETMGSFYGCRKACEPLHIQLNANDRGVCVVNATLKPQDGLTAVYELYTIDGKKADSKRCKVYIEENSAKKILTLPHPPKDSKPYIERLILKDKRGHVLSVNDYFATDADGSLSAMNGLDTAKISAEISRKGRVSTIKLKNTGNVPAISLKLNARDRSSGTRILPAYASDGYFNLMPGESRVVTMEYDCGDNDAVISMEGYNLERTIL